MSTKLFDNYQTDGSANIISLEVKIGFAQLGSTSISLNGVQLITPAADPNGNYKGSFKIDLGTNAALSGKLLTIISGIEILQQPGASSLTLTLKGAKSGPHQYILQSAPGAATGFVVNYFALISFI